MANADVCDFNNIDVMIHFINIELHQQILMEVDLMSKSKSEEYADRIMPVLSEQQILDNFTDEELRQVGLNMGYNIPQGTKFHDQPKSEQHDESATQNK